MLLLVAVAVLSRSQLGHGLAEGLRAGTAQRAAAADTCKEVREFYPHGVGRTGAVDDPAKGHHRVTGFATSSAGYRAVVRAHAKFDQDHDGIACER